MAHSFEPQAHLIDVIKNTGFEPDRQCGVAPCSCWRKIGEGIFEAGQCQNSGMAEFRPGVGDRPVDDVVSDEHVTGVKIDVEGI